MAMKVVAVAVAAVLAAVACGGRDDVPLAELPDRLARAQCGRAFRCCSLAQIQQLYGAGITDEETCVAQLSLAIGVLLSADTSISAGRVRYNGATAGVCFSKLATAACTASSNDLSVVPECDAYLEPQVPAGGICRGNTDCQTGFCDRDLTSSADGACGEIPSLGMPCTSRCTPGSYCSNAQTCVAPKADGSFCITDDECISATCDNPDITGGTCVPAPAATCGPSP